MLLRLTDLPGAHRTRARASCIGDHAEQSSLPSAAIGAELGRLFLHVHAFGLFGFKL